MTCLRLITHFRSPLQSANSGSFKTVSGGSPGRDITELEALNSQSKDMVVCKKCLTGTLSVTYSVDKLVGLNSTLIWKCGNYSYTQEGQTSKLYDNSRVAEVNRSVVLGMRCVGNCRDATLKCSIH